MESKVMRIPAALVPRVRKLIADYKQELKDAKVAKAQQEKAEKTTAEPTVVMRVPVALEKDIQKLKEEHKDGEAI